MSQVQSTNQQLLNRIGGVSLIAMALCYCIVFVIYGALLPPLKGNDISDKIQFLTGNAALINLSYIVGYVIFACFLCISVQIIQRKYTASSSLLLSTASLFGLFWALVLLAAGMIGITSTNLIATMGQGDAIAAEASYQTAIILQEGLGGGIELLGGIWVLLIGIFGWQHNVYSKAFCAFSVLKGFIGIATLVSTEALLRDSFGLTGIVWFIWLAVIMLKQKSISEL